MVEKDGIVKSVILSFCEQFKQKKQFKQILNNLKNFLEVGHIRVIIMNPDFAARPISAFSVLYKKHFQQN